jgi:hypothetical protein
VSEEALKIAIGVVTVIAFAIAFLLTGGCKKPLVADDGPTTGVCTPLQYDGDVIVNQTCAWRGYVWACTGEPADNCIRGAALPQEKIP